MDFYLRLSTGVERLDKIATISSTEVITQWHNVWDSESKTGIDRQGEPDYRATENKM